MMIPIDEAVETKGFPARATLRRWAAAGDIRAERTLKGSREVWLVCPDSIRARLAGQDPQKADYKRLYSQWIAEASNGYHSGRPMGSRAIEGLEYGMSAYWEVMKRPASIQAVTPQDLKHALTSIVPDYEERRCYFGKREKIYKAVCSFIQFLIREGLRTQTDLLEARTLKPKRIYPPRKTVLKEPSFYELLEKNDTMTAGRTAFDRKLTRTIIMLAGMAGLRREELIDLEVGHIRLEEQELDVIDGKGHKDRTIGITPALLKQIESWLKTRPKSRFKNLLLAKTGLPLDERGIGRRLERVAQGKVTLHGLRRTFATVNIERGIPVPVMQLLLGHTDIKTTMGYVLIDKQTAVDMLKSRTE